MLFMLFCMQCYILLMPHLSFVGGGVSKNQSNLAVAQRDFCKTFNALDLKDQRITHSHTVSLYIAQRRLYYKFPLK